MSILQEVLAWSKTISPWQSDAIARLLAKQALSNEDIKDMFALLKSANGIDDPEKRVAKPLSAEQIPAQANVADHISLHAIKNFKNVNAIAEGETLPIGPKGLTVIYGDNGSGKSGYSRVLKKACRARDQSEPVLQNANLLLDKTKQTTADFVISVNNEAPKDISWVLGQTAPAVLSSISIFDSRCARAYLDNEDDFSYVPYGMDVFEGLAKLCKELKGMLDAEHGQYAVNLAPLAHLHGETAVGKLVVGLNAKTNPATVETLSTVTEAEFSRHEELDKSLKETSPKEKAAGLRATAKRVAAVAANVEQKDALVGAVLSAKLKLLSDAYRAAQGAAAVAAQNFKENDNLLPGTGGDVWRELFEAARKFSPESHPGHRFPDLGPESACPLCQQALGDSAKRMLRFEEYIQQEAERTVQAKRLALNAEYKPLTMHSLSLNFDDVTYGEVAAREENLASDTRSFEKGLELRREKLKHAVINNVWDGVDAAVATPALRLTELCLKLNTQAETLEKASDEQARAKLQKEFGELDSRLKLANVKEYVLSAITFYARQAALIKCQSAIKTNGISLKSAEIAEKVISNELAAALSEEFRVLGVGALNVCLKSRGDKGKPLHKLKLELQQAKNPGEILSEGEQRAIAIASFLAEISLGGGVGGIVFDDPVSSLDHKRRERVAARLVEEAANRQVIIFTHDIYFLSILAEEAKSADVPIATQSLIRRPQGYGVADPELPFEGRNVSARIGALKDSHQRIAKLYKEGDELEHKRLTVEAYFRLRMTWERAVEEVLMRRVLLRFRKGVETQRLAEVSIDDSDYAEISAGMSKCSNYAHDKAYAGGVAVPDPTELLADIGAFEKWRAENDAKSKLAAKSRK
jgi:energy-coupling factor transporter ATP-binding protein EcfA2